MGTFNAVRLVNVLYNEKQNCILDETFRCGGVHTLLELRNGGGKTVMVQLIQGLFTGGTHRDAAKTKRMFSDLFVEGRAPTFVLVEWNLDSGGRIVTGMAACRPRGSDGYVDMRCFIGDCGMDSGCPYRAEALPLSRKTESGISISIKSMDEAEALLEKFQQRHKGKFFVYKMQARTAPARYFQDLASYGIYRHEWEDVVSAVNSGEGAFEAAFPKGCTLGSDRDLLEGWILKRIDKKLAQDGDVLKEMQEAFVRHTFEYGKIKEDWLKKEALEEFCRKLDGFAAKASETAAADREFGNAARRTAAVAKGLETLAGSVRTEMENARKLQEEAEMSLRRNEFQKRSVALHRARLKVEDAEGQIAEQEKMLQKLKDGEAECRRTVSVHECRKTWKKMDACRQKLAEAKKALDVARDAERKANETLAAERDALRGQIKHALTERHRTLEADAAQKEEACRAASARLDELQRVQNDAAERIQRMQNEESRLRGSCEAYEREAKKYGNGEGVVPGVLLSPLDYSQSARRAFEACLSGLDGAMQKAEAEMENMQKLIGENAAAVRTAETDRDNAVAHILQTSEAAAMARRLLEDAEAKKRRLQQEAQSLGIEGRGVWDAAGIAAKLAASAKEHASKAVGAAAEKLNLQLEEICLQTGNFTGLSAEEEAVLEEVFGIHAVYGAKWLRDMEESPESKRRTLQRLPLLPKALVVPAEKMKSILEAEEWPLQKTVVFIAHEAVSGGGEVSGAGEGAGGILVRTAAGAELFDAGAAAAKIEEIREQKRRAEELEKRHMESTEELNARAAGVQKAAIAKEEFERIEKAAETAAGAAEQAVKAKKDADDLIGRLKLQGDGFAREVETCRQAAADARKKYDEFARLNDGHRQAAETMKAVRKLQADVKAEEANLAEAKEGARHAARILQERKTSLQAAMDKKEASAEKLQELKDVAPASPPDGFDVAAAETEVKALNEQLGGAAVNVAMLEERAASAASRLNELQEELDRGMQKCGASQEEVCEEPAGDEYLAKLEQDAADYAGQINAANARNRELIEALGSCRSEAGAAEQAVRSLKCGEPLDAEAIGRDGLLDVDFDGRAEEFSRTAETARRDAAACDGRLKTAERLLQTCGDCSLPNDADEILPDRFPIKALDDGSLEAAVGCAIDARKKTLERLAGEKKAMYQLADRMHSDAEAMQNQDISIMTRDLRSSALDLTMNSQNMNSQDMSGAAQRFYEGVQAMRQGLADEIGMLAESVKDVKKMEGMLADRVLEYVMDVGKELSAFSRSAKISCGSRRGIDALRMTLPVWADCEDQYRIKSFEAMRRIREDCLAAAAAGTGVFNADAAYGEAKRLASTRALFSSVVDVDRIQISVLKPDNGRSKLMRWQDASKLSGGEQSFGMIVLIAALMNYLHRRSGDSFARKESKVLLLDNPFGKINSEDLLTPLKQVADMYGIQLVCLTAHSEQSIDRFFGNHYLLHLVPCGGGRVCLSVETVKETGEPDAADVVEMRSVHVMRGAPQKSLLDV